MLTKMDGRKEEEERVTEESTVVETVLANSVSARARRVGTSRYNCGGGAQPQVPKVDLAKNN